jgi:DNA uptake protein ComE-like DNA-binding protein
MAKAHIIFLALAAAVFAAIDFPGAVSTALAQENGAANMARLNPNSASEAELAALPLLDEATIARILAARPFETPGDFDTALGDGLSDTQKQELFATLFVPIDLHTASRADIMLIPGMTRRMAHEFEEYRPYTSIEQFNREIGKYVDEDEVARLRSYVTLD